MAALLGFEAKGIQSWIMAGGKMRDLAGGSELVEQITGQFLSAALTAVGIAHRFDQGDAVPEIDQGDGKVLVAGAGQFRLQLDDDAKATRLASLLPPFLDDWAPGLRHTVAMVPIGSADDVGAAFEHLVRTLQAEANRVDAVLPVVGPLVLRDQRTGLAAVETFDPNRDAEPGSPTEPIEAIDAQTGRRRRVALAMRRGLPSQSRATRPSALKRRLFGSDGPDFATEISDITYATENSTIAIIHADGNGLGNLIINLAHIPNFLKIYQDLSRSVRDATLGALRITLTQTFPECAAQATASAIPARPIVVGGDDVTLVVPGRVGVPVAATFLSAFAERTADALAEIRDQHSIARDDFPEKLTACAGVALVKDHTPFEQGHALAESLCAFAKRRARRPGGTSSALAFHRVTTTIARDFNDILAWDLTEPRPCPAADEADAERRASTLSLTMGPYLVEPQDRGAAGAGTPAHLESLTQNRTGCVYHTSVHP